MIRRKQLRNANIGNQPQWGTKLLICHALVVQFLCIEVGTKPVKLRRLGKKPAAPEMPDSNSENSDDEKNRVVDNSGAKAR